MTRKIKKIKKQAIVLAPHESPTSAAQELDALFYFIHKRYAKTSTGVLPNLGTFFITRAEVIFANVPAVTIIKKTNRRTLQIVTPQVDSHLEEDRRIYLLNQFGDLILKYQKQAYLQVREMLLTITEPAGRETLIEDFENYKKTLNSPDRSHG